MTDRELKKKLSETGTGKIFLNDNSGLYLKLRSKTKWFWHYDYKIDGKPTVKSFGSYPVVSMSEAKKKLLLFKADLERGVNPQTIRREKAKTAKNALTFQECFLSWFEKRTVHLSEDYRKQITSRMQNHILPFIGSMPVSEIDKAAILIPVRKQEETSAQMAHKLLGHIREVLAFAVASGVIDTNPAEGLIAALKKVTGKTHHPCITDPVRLGQILRAIDDYTGTAEVVYALKIMPYVFVRSGELRGAEWKEIDLDAGLWTIPAERMKANRPHLVPLASQVVCFFRELQDLQLLKSDKVFPSIAKEGFISPESIRNALFRCGISRHEQDIHGFRGTASTLLREAGKYHSEIVERQLAHIVGNATAMAYDHSERLEERRAMMQWWADYLDRLKAEI